MVVIHEFLALHRSSQRYPDTTTNTPTMKLSDQLRRAANESSPGVTGKNPFAALLLQAARHIENASDTALVDFIEQECSITLRHGASTLVNPQDLRRAIADVQADHAFAESFHSNPPASALRLAS